MTARRRRFLADANVDSAVVTALRALGHDAVHARDLGLAQASDESIMRRAFGERRIVLTHDSDFGRLAIVDRVPFIGIVYVRPGHIDSAFTLQTVATVLAGRLPRRRGFLIVARRTRQLVAIRVRFVR